MSQVKRFRSLVSAMCAEKHTFGAAADVLKARLINIAVNPDWDVWADCSANEIANGNGYLTGGLTIVTVSFAADANGITRLILTSPVWNSTVAGMASYQSLILLNDTAPSDELVAYQDFGFLRGVIAGKAAPIFWDETNGALVFD